jgi:hypothetical protein
MNDQDGNFRRRDFLKSAVVGGAAAAAGSLSQAATLEQPPTP